MSSTILDLLVAASRPFVPFKASINGTEFSLLARKLSLAESQKIGDLWDNTYSEVRNKYDDASVDTASIFARIKRADAKTLSKYIAEADKNDFVPDAMAMTEKSADSPEVKAEVEKMVEDKQAELILLSLDELKNLAYARRAHFYASNQASEATARQTAAYIIHTEEKVQLFPSLGETSELSFEDLVTLITKADEALSDKKISPLKSAPNSPLEKQIQSVEDTVEELKTSSTS